MIVKIEDYRGVEIKFNTHTSRFETSVTDSDTKESKSFDAVKKFIDEYKKANQSFEPFFVEHKDGSNKLKVVGIRKDNLFQVECEDGSTQALSKLDMNNYILRNPANDDIQKQLKEKLEEYMLTIDRHRQAREDLINQITGVTLKEYKKTLDI